MAKSAELLNGPALVFVFVCPHININGFDMAKSAAQLLYGPVLVFLHTAHGGFKLKKKMIITFN